MARPIQRGKRKDSKPKVKKTTDKSITNKGENQNINQIPIKLIGENEDQKEAQEFLSKAFGVALFMMLIILFLFVEYFLLVHLCNHHYFAFHKIPLKD